MPHIYEGMCIAARQFDLRMYTIREGAFRFGMSRGSHQSLFLLAFKMDLNRFECHLKVKGKFFTAA